MPIPISQTLQLAGQQEVTPWQLPFDELARGLKQKQNTQDAAIKDLEAQKELAAKLDSLPQDRREAIDLIDNIYTQSNALSYGVDLTTREGMTAVQMLKDGVRKEFSPGGKANAIETNLNTFNEWDKRQKEKVGKKDGITQEQYEAGKNFFMNNYEGVGEFNPITGMYNSFETEEIAEFVDLPTRIKDFVKDTKASASKVTTDALSGDQRWVIETTSGIKEVTEAEIMEIAIQKLYRDDKSVNYLTQAQKFGMIGEGSFYNSETGQYTPYVTQVIQNRKTKEFIDPEVFENLTEQEKSGYIISEQLNPTHYLTPIIQAVASEYGFKETEFSQTRSANKFAEIDYAFSLENMVTNYNFESPGMTVNAPGGVTGASVDKFIQSTEQAAQNTLDSYLNSNVNTRSLVGELTPEQWLSGDLPPEINNFTPELINEISYKLNRMMLEKDAEEQRLNQAEKAAGIDELTPMLDSIYGLLDNLYPQGYITSQGSLISKDDLEQAVENYGETDVPEGEYYIDESGYLFISNRKPIKEGGGGPIFITANLDEDLVKNLQKNSKALKNYKKRLNENLEENKTTVTTHGMTTTLPNEENLDPKYVKSAKDGLNSLLAEAAYFDRTMVAVSEEDINALTEFTGTDFSQFVQNGKIPASRINEYVDKAEASGDYKNLAFSSQPLDGARYVSKPFVLTMGAGVDAKTLAIPLYFPLGDGQNGTIGNTEINKVFQSNAAQAQEIILHPFQRGLESYTPLQAPNITILNTGNANNVKLNYTDRATGKVQEISTTLNEATRIVEDALYLHNKKIEYLSNQPTYNSILQLSSEKGIPFAEAEKLIISSKQ